MQTAKHVLSQAHTHKGAFAKMATATTYSVKLVKPTPSAQTVSNSVRMGCQSNALNVLKGISSLALSDNVSQLVLFLTAHNVMKAAMDFARNV